MPTPTIIIIPGAWHTSQHYTKLINALAAQDYTAVAVPLPSVNPSPPLTSWEEDACAVRAAITAELDAGRDVIALAHSFGGVAIGEAVKGLGRGERMKGESQPGLGRQGAVVGLVYMCAMALPKRQTHVGQMVPVGVAEEEIEGERNEYGARNGGTGMNEDGAIVLSKDSVRDVFHNRCDPVDVEEALDMLGSFPPGPLSIPVTYTAYLEIPSMYIVCQNDRALPPPVQERMIAQGNGAFRVERRQEGHSPFLSNPGFVVGCVRSLGIEWLNGCYTL